jgi:hypothetical protein
MHDAAFNGTGRGDGRRRCGKRRRIVGTRGGSVEVDQRLAAGNRSGMAVA